MAVRAFGRLVCKRDVRETREAQKHLAMRFRFTIRDLLWLTALVAVLLAWWVDRRSNQRQFANEYNALRDDFVNLRQLLITSRYTGSTGRRFERMDRIPDVPAAKTPQ